MIGSIKGYLLAKCIYEEASQHDLMNTLIEDVLAEMLARPTRPDPIGEELGVEPLPGGVFWILCKRVFV